MAGLAMAGAEARRALYDTALKGVRDLLGVASRGSEVSCALRDRPEVRGVILLGSGDWQVVAGCAAARAGTHIAFESLDAPTQASIERLVAACRASRVTLTPLRPWRHAPVPRGLKAVRERGDLGAVRFAHLTLIEAAGGYEEEALYGKLSRGMDILTWLVRTPVTEVFARACSLDDSGAPGYISAVLGFDDAGQGIVEVGRIPGLAPATGIRRIGLTGLRGSAAYDERESDVLLGSAGARPLAADAAAAVSASLTEWSLVLSGKQPAQPPCVPSEHNLARAALESARIGLPVRMGVGSRARSERRGRRGRTSAQSGSR